MADQIPSFEGKLLFFRSWRNTDKKQESQRSSCVVQHYYAKLQTQTLYFYKLENQLQLQFAYHLGVNVCVSSVVERQNAGALENQTRLGGLWNSAFQTILNPTNQNNQLELSKFFFEVTDSKNYFEPFLLGFESKATALEWSASVVSHCKREQADPESEMHKATFQKPKVVEDHVITRVSNTQSSTDQASSSQSADVSKVKPLQSLDKRSFHTRPKSVTSQQQQSQQQDQSTNSNALKMPNSDQLKQSVQSTVSSGYAAGSRTNNPFQPNSAPNVPDTRGWTPYCHKSGVTMLLHSASKARASLLFTEIDCAPARLFRYLSDVHGPLCSVWGLKPVQHSLSSPNNSADATQQQFDTLSFGLRGSTASWLTSPRRLRVTRALRRDMQGQYTITFKSVKQSSSSVLQSTVESVVGPSVEAHLYNAVLSIHPIHQGAPNVPESPSFHQHPTNARALLVLIFDIDLGGYLSPSSALYSYSQWLVELWHESLLESVAAIKAIIQTQTFSHGLFSSQVAQPPSICSLDLQAESATVLEPKLRVSTSKPQPWLSENYWKCPGPSVFSLRGAAYLTDRKKYPAPEPIFKLKSLELLTYKTRTKHVAPLLPNVMNDSENFHFVMVFLVPGPPWYHLIADFIVPHQQLQPHHDDDDGADHSAFWTCLNRFINGGDAMRNNKLKMIPAVIEGPWLVRKAVGTKPVIIGRKLVTNYYSQAGRYLEADVDIGSNVTATGVTQMVIGAVTSLVIDIGLLIEGQALDELPEVLIGTLRLNYVDLTKGTPLVEDTDSAGGGDVKDVVGGANGVFANDSVNAMQVGASENMVGGVEQDAFAVKR